MKNKRLMLLALPILMVLSSCGNVSINNKEIDSIKEETSISNEIFGQEEQPYNLNIKGPRYAIEDLVEPMIGVQFKSYTESGTDYYAIRYVATIKGLDVTATWTRAVSDLNGNPTRSLNTIPVTKAYKTLNDGGVISTCSIEYPGYEYYVVYTMYDIPATTDNGKLYMMAYLTLSYAEETPVKSKAVVAQINGTGRIFSFDTNRVTNDYFINIYHANEVDPLLQNSIYYGTSGEDKPNPAENDLAVFTDPEMEFVSGDRFGLFKYDGSSFKFCNFSTYFGSTAGRFTKTTNTSEYYGDLYLAGKYNIFINYLEKAYVNPTDVTTMISFVPNSDWLSVHYDIIPRFAIYAFGGSVGEAWFSLTKKGAQNLYQIENFNIGTYPTIIFCRMDPRSGYEANNWSNKINQTGNIEINGTSGPSRIDFNKYTLSNEKYGGDTWDNFIGSWSK